MTYCRDARLVRLGGLPTSNMLVGCLFNPRCGLFFGALCLHRRYIRALLSCNTCLLSKFNPYGVYFILSPFSTLLYLLYICKIFADIQQIYDYY